MAFANLRTTMDMAEWDAATVKINYALKSAVPDGRSAVSRSCAALTAKTWTQRLTGRGDA